MFIRFEYQSQYFVEQLQAIRKNPAVQDNPGGKSVYKTTSHMIDLTNNIVVKSNHQKFKFEALQPFETQTKVEFTNVSPLLFTNLPFVL